MEIAKRQNLAMNLEDMGDVHPRHMAQKQGYYGLGHPYQRKLDHTYLSIGTTVAADSE